MAFENVEIVKGQDRLEYFGRWIGLASETCILHAYHGVVEKGQAIMKHPVENVKDQWHKSAQMTIVNTHSHFHSRSHPLITYALSVVESIKQSIGTTPSKMTRLYGSGWR